MSGQCSLLSALPTETILSVIAYLPPQDVQSLSLVNRAFRVLALPSLFQNITLHFSEQSFDSFLQFLDSPHAQHVKHLTYMPYFFPVPHPCPKTSFSKCCIKQSARLRKKFKCPTKQERARLLKKAERTLCAAVQVIPNVTSFTLIMGLPYVPLFVRRDVTFCFQDSIEQHLQSILPMMRFCQRKPRPVSELFLDIFYSYSPMRNSDLIRGLRDALRGIKTLRLRGQYRFWQPVLVPDSLKSLSLLELNDCTMEPQVLVNFLRASMKQQQDILVHLVKVGLFPYGELGYITMSGTPSNILMGLESKMRNSMRT